MGALGALSAKALFVLLGGFLGVISYKLLTGGVRLQGLLLDASPKPRLSPARVQLLAFTIAAAADYVTKAVQSPGDALPAPSQQMLVVLGASQGFYAASKATTRLIVPFIEKVLNKRRR